MASTIPARVAGAFKLHGRTLTVESADATSYVALAHAVSSLRGNVSDAVLVLTGQRREGPLLASALAAKGLLAPGHPFAADGRGFALGEGVGALLLTIRFWRDESPPIAIWYGLFHSVSAFCNAGFDLEGGYRSMARYETSPWMNAVLFALIQAGALSYMVLADAWNTRRWRRFSSWAT